MTGSVNEDDISQASHVHLRRPNQALSHIQVLLTLIRIRRKSWGSS
jgi:hypothetical protein